MYVSPPANIVRNGVSGGALISSHIPPGGGAIFRPADLFRDTGTMSYFLSIFYVMLFAVTHDSVRLSDDVSTNQILRTCCKAQEGVRPSSDWNRPRSRLPAAWIHQIHRVTGILVTDALELAADRSFWRQIAMARCYGWTLRAVNEWMNQSFDPSDTVMLVLRRLYVTTVFVNVAFSNENADEKVFWGASPANYLK